MLHSFSVLCGQTNMVVIPDDNMYVAYIFMYIFVFYVFLCILNFYISLYF